MAVGPYRNLTTLTAAVLFLHPQCQVLNHAGDRIFGTEYDLFSACTPGGVERFLRHAVALSAGGSRGAYGGSITFSHAFDRHRRLPTLFGATGLPLVKGDIRALFWKESHRISHRIRECGTNLSALLAADPRPRFLLPIRHPLDCAVSNIRTNHVRFFRGLADPTDVGQVCDAVLDEIRQVCDLAERFPGRFRHFFEHSLDDEMLVGLEAFLELEHHAPWLALAREAMTSTSRYVHPPARQARYRASVEAKFSDLPEVADGLLAFVGTA
jgi:hypothetical protein